MKIKLVGELHISGDPPMERQQKIEIGLKLASRILGEYKHLMVWPMAHIFSKSLQFGNSSNKLDYKTKKYVPITNFKVDSHSVCLGFEERAKVPVSQYEVQIGSVRVVYKGSVDYFAVELYEGSNLQVSQSLTQLRESPEARAVVKNESKKRSTLPS